MASNEPITQVVGFRLPTKLVTALDQWAVEDRRTRSNLVLGLLIDAVVKEGYLREVKREDIR